MSWPNPSSPSARRRPDPGPGRSAFDAVRPAYRAEPPTPPPLGVDGHGRGRARCDCNGPCMCAVPVPLLRWFAAQVSVYHGPTADVATGLCGQEVRRCGMCMLVAGLHRAARDRWPGILP